ncbi:MAG: YebC/PmpR family DNA-binding transcriptional regulator [Alphaproteobacteria bacterium]|nr:YebC/PmpR family DNA-binding transcriptional regulator [Alphaproteobacteria bacterium]MBV8548520.1 YebC/PmpR family DNA-binding transcriptional regulator [Alphaproteobacteria bacterium]
MAGHSHAKNVMYQKGKSDAKRSKLFNKLGREIMVAAKSGLPDPASNPRLRAAIIEARKNNMPRDRIDRAIAAAQPGATDGANYEEVRYEGYGPGGIALIVEALTDNRNRTASELRTAFSKNGGAMGESGSVAFMFTRCGEIVFPAKVATADAMLEAVINAGGDNVESDDVLHVVTTTVEDFGAVRDALEKQFGDTESAKLIWRANIETPVTGEPAAALVKLIDVLEDNDDVQNVYGNHAIDAAEWEKLAS